MWIHTPNTFSPRPAQASNTTTINVDRDGDASEWVKRQNDGKERKPTIDICGRILTSPSNQQLEEALRTQRLLG